MRTRGVRNRLDFLDPKYPQVGEPTVESKQRVVVGADVLRSWLTGDSVIEHPATETPSIHAGSTPNPMSRRVKTSMTTMTQ
jgi:hypothetical protein